MTIKVELGPRYKLTVFRILDPKGAPLAVAPTRIGNGVFLGPQVIVQKGVTIGDKAVVGAASFVNKDVPAGAKAWGNPAQVKG